MDVQEAHLDYDFQEGSISPAGQVMSQKIGHEMLTRS